MTVKEFLNKNRLKILNLERGYYIVVQSQAGKYKIYSSDLHGGKKIVRRIRCFGGGIAEITT